MGLWDVDLNVAHEQSDDVLSNESSSSRAVELAIHSCVLNTKVNDVMEVLFEFITSFCLEKISQAIAVGCDVDVMAELARLIQDHAAS